MAKSKQFIDNVLWFKFIRKNDIPIVGGKGANLGEMANNNIPVPPGFVVTADAYFAFIEKANLQREIIRKVKSINEEDTEQLDKVTAEIREMIAKAPMSEDLQAEIMTNYMKLGEKKLGIGGMSSISEEYVAVRSSATAEDLPEASFAGQQDTYLNIRGKKEVVDAVKRCWASLFTPRATYYRKKQGFDIRKIGIAVVVQRMINSEMSGVMFTADPTGDESKIVIEGIFGLGEAIVSGAVTPDNYIVDKKSGRIDDTRVNYQKWKLVRSGRENKKVALNETEGKRQKMRDDFIEEVARWGKKIEKLYGAPQDIEFAIEDNTVYIVQSRAITTLGLGKIGKSKVQTDEEPFLVGLAGSPGIVIGKVKIAETLEDAKNLEEGSILVTKQTNPDWVVYMKKAKAIITDEGGRTAHAAIVSRELGIPCVVGTGDATELLANGDVVTVDGYNGHVYEGEIEIKAPEKKEAHEEVVKTEEVPELEKEILAEEGEVEGIAKKIGEGKIVDGKKAESEEKAETIAEETIEAQPEIKGEPAYEEELETESEETKEIVEELEEEVEGHKGLGEEKITIMKYLESVAAKVKANVALPEAAESAAKAGADGIGLLRAEHMIASSGKHPAEFIRQGKFDELVKTVKEGIRKVAEHFKDKPVWYRTFDARTDEFRNLEGGDKEPKENNPMIGWHGIRRDLDEPEMLKAQLQAVKELYEEGFTHVGVMLPFVQSVDEFKQAKQIAEEVGLPIGKNKVEFGVMVETPAAVWVIDELIAEGIDFASFGTNDLTQLTLGLDRGNENIQRWFTELHPAILRQLEHVISRCRKAGVKTSICGQAGSNPEMVRHLVRMGIDSVSANIDAVQEIKRVVLLEEKEKLMRKAERREGHVEGV